MHVVAPVHYIPIIMLTSISIYLCIILDTLKDNFTKCTHYIIISGTIKCIIIIIIESVDSISRDGPDYLSLCTDSSLLTVIIVTYV